jgi:hypothetical protein
MIAPPPPTNRAPRTAMDDAALPITRVALHLVEAAEQGLVDSLLAAVLIRTATSRIRARIREIDAILT